MPDAIWQIGAEEKSDGVWQIARHPAGAASPNFADAVCEICRHFPLEKAADGVGQRWKTIWGMKTMNPDWLLNYFKEISEAPDAVSHLRRFILDLAVRGKLVKQDPNDEPGSKLVERIQTETSQTTRHGSRGEEASLPQDNEANSPFRLPSGWAWSRFPKLGTFGRGKSKHRPRNDPSLFEGGTHLFVQTGDIARSNGIVKTFTGKYNELGLAQSAKWPSGTLCITIAANIADSGILSFEACFPDSIVGFIPASPFPNARYFEYFIRTAKAELHEFAPATAQKNINLAILNEVLIPIPPLAEQHRIVAKVDELTALCDEFETAQQKRERRRDRLVAATLNGLNNGAARAETHERPGFEESAWFYFNHLPRLTTRPEHLQQLRQTILNLAVRGKLVPQDPNDEPASEPLKRINAAKALQEKEGKIRKETLFEDSQNDEIPFTVPEMWKWTQLGELTELITKGSSPKWQGISYVSKATGILFITSENVGNYRLRKLDELKYVEKKFNEIESRSILRNGDILMNLVGASIGRTAVYDLHDEANINQAVALIRLIHSTSSLCLGFLLHYLNSPPAIAYMMGSQVVNAQPNISLTNAREFPIPFPPLTEQHRIVAKVDELMAICNGIELRLSTTAASRYQFLEATLQEALS